MVSITFAQIVSLFVTHLLEIVVSASVPVLVVAASRFSKPYIARAKLFIDQNHLEVARDLIITAIQAAEKKWAGPDNGATRKAWAIATVDEYLRSRGIVIPVAQLEAELEAAIHNGLEQAGATAQEPERSPLGFDVSHVQGVGIVSGEDEDETEG